MAIVYQHRRNDTNQVFYIGIGKTLSRAYNKRNARNAYWKNIAKNGYTVEIVADNLCWEQVCIIERLLIVRYGRKDTDGGTLVNMTDGGDGISGVSDETRVKMSGKRKGQSHRQPRTDEHKMKIGSRHKGKIVSTETRVKMSISRKGQKRSEETKLKMSIAAKAKWQKNKNI